MKKIIYSIIEFLLLGRGIAIHISGFKLRVPFRYIRYFEPEYELNNINFINNYVNPGDVVIDVGAHIGLLSTIIAKKIQQTGRVYSFEPTPSTFHLLNKTIKINHIEKIVIPIKAAVSDTNSKTRFYVTDIEAHNSNSLVDNKRDYAKETSVEVDLISIDSFIEQKNIKKINFIKIDAEGAEFSVLKGAKKTIETFHPLIILALHPGSITNFGDSLADIWDYIINNQYKILLNNNEIDKNYFIKQAGLFDVFLIPHNRLSLK